MRFKFFTILLLSLVLLLHCSYAQLCQGSLGDPIVNITFGAGSNPGAQLLAATTNYQFTSTDCPDDGYYTVRNNTNACFNNSWHSLAADHTGDPGGYFMLVNASLQPSAFYLDTVRGLCGNTTYEFAAWILNVLLPSSCNSAGNQPDLTFRIEKTDGTLLQSYNTGSISTTASPAWKQYGFFFTTPAAVTDVVLRIVNNAAGGCGNDLALDDITFRPCGPAITNTIDGNPATAFSFCQGPVLHQYLLSCSLSGGFNNPTFIWQTKTPQNNTWTDLAFATTNSIGFAIAPNAPVGTYQARLAVAEAGNLGSAQCRIYSAPFTFIINANPVTTATNNGPACEGATLTMNSTGGAQYAWTGPNGFSGSGSPLSLGNIQLNQAGKYYVTVTSTAGCIHKDSTMVLVNPAPIASTSFTNATICEADSIQMIAGGGQSYQWTPSAGLSNAAINNPKASPTLTTTYNVIVGNQFTCKDTVAITINVINKPVVNAGPDKIIFKGQSAQLLGTVTGNGNTYSWSPPAYINDIFSLQPFVNPPADTKYILRTSSSFGCKSVSDTMLVKVYNGMYIPNAFSPNADGINDTWNIPSLSAYPAFELFIYGRWGQLVFHTTTNPVAWDGKYKNTDCPNGAYTYIIKTGKELFKGSVIIIR